MAQPVMPAPERMGFVVRTGCCGMIMLAAGLVGAESLSDPTRPSASLTTGQQAAVVGEGGAAGGPVLQSVLVSQGRKLAVIGGRVLKVGDKFGAATLVKITESEVVLRNGNDTQVLKLFSGVEKRVTSDHPPAQKQ